MITENETKLLDVIQLSLEKLKDNGVDVLFMTSDKNRGVISGSYGGLASLLAFNMVSYPQFKVIVDTALKVYNEYYDTIKEVVDEHKPSHEIIDNYGLDISEILNNIIQPKNDNNP